MDIVAKGTTWYINPSGEKVAGLEISPLLPSQRVNM